MCNWYLTIHFFIKLSEAFQILPILKFLISLLNHTCVMPHEVYENIDARTPDRFSFGLRVCNCSHLLQSQWELCHLVTKEIDCRYGKCEINILLCSRSGPVGMWHECEAMHIHCLPWNWLKGVIMSYFKRCISNPI